MKNFISWLGAVLVALFSFIWSVIAFLASITLYMLTILVPSFIIQVSIDRLFDYKLDLFGIYLAILAMIAIKSLYFDKD